MSATDSIQAYEDNAGGVYLQHGTDSTAWFLGPVTPDLNGKFDEDASAWHAGDWEPGEPNGQEPTDSLDGLEHIATWTPGDGVRIVHSPSGDPIAGGGGQAYLGISDDV
ncbi:hypothetical protein [Streptomyces gardneri]|uniref:hypothetical protein n=1 Tax=Streptomyces gardneri TaxID=66892 RepID=UPI0035D6FB6D